ncbi:MAG: hypothetical protein U5L98_05020 [Halomonas sp.]|uniref:hypothetical protein n=1 Tax=Halomonas sp. TaxID=1486246 RepID=UPI002ACD54A6|nr:hypothetical protein [Halomonas sp.]MDZ7852015.1 hypothetical protein [Halomonas sp.]
MTLDGWRLDCCWSSGERALASHLSEAGKTTKAGQDARLPRYPRHRAPPRRVR